MNKHQALTESQLAMSRFHQAMKATDGFIALGKKITRLCLGEKVELTVAEATAIACSVESTIYLSSAIQLNARDQKQPAVDQASGSLDIPGTKTGQLANGFAIPN